jgi:methylase of polypeptide subunit release factors
MNPEFKNFEITVDHQNNVFDPSFFDASYHFAYSVCEYYEKYYYKKLLSVGCGTGVDFAYLIDSCISINKQLPHLSFLDIDPFAVQNSQLNFAQICGDRAEFIVADLFPTKGLLYNFICWNVPFFDMDPPKGEKYAKARFDQNYESLTRFILTVPSYLAQDGHILIMYSEFGKDKIRNIVSNSGLQLIGQTQMPIMICLNTSLPESLHFNIYIELYELKKIP